MTTLRLLHQQLPLVFMDGRRPRFDLYYPGPNGEVLASVQAAAESLGPNLYLWGASGAGKTHLLQAACQRATEGNRRAAYIPLGQHAQWDVALLESLEVLDLVCIDDIGMIAGHSDWEIGIFNLFNRLRECEGRLMMAGDSVPSELNLGLQDLSSRLSWGLVLHLKPLDDNEKIAALQRRANARGFDLSPEVGRYLLARLPRDMDGLCKVLDTLDDATLALQRRLTIPLVRALLIQRLATNR